MNKGFLHIQCTSSAAAAPPVMLVTHVLTD
jgi:hypothetical protein